MTSNPFSIVKAIPALMKICSLFTHRDLHTFDAKRDPNSLFSMVHTQGAEIKCLSNVETH